MEERRTTPPPLVDVTDHFPELADRAKVTIRLHPRPAQVKEMKASKLGGAILWPGDESWPRCSEHGVNYVAVIQLMRSEIPQFPFKSDADVFQLLWCPHSHKSCEWLPEARVYWRRVSDKRDWVSTRPELQLKEELLEYDAGQFVSKECRFYPEPVVEYPSTMELEASLITKLEQWDISGISIPEELRQSWEPLPFDPGYWLYVTELSEAPGTKAGGYPQWIQNVEYPICDCGHRMEHILSISSLEETYGPPTHRWIPLEEKHLSDEIRYDLHYGTKLMFGDGGVVYIFVCRLCEDWPIKFIWQCG